MLSDAMSQPLTEDLSDTMVVDFRSVSWMNTGDLKEPGRSEVVRLHVAPLTYSKARASEQVRSVSLTHYTACKSGARA